MPTPRKMRANFGPPTTTITIDADLSRWFRIMAESSPEFDRAARRAVTTIDQCCRSFKAMLDSQPETERKLQELQRFVKP